MFPPSIPVFLIAMVMGLSWDAATGTGDFGEAVKPRQEAVQICQVKSEAAKAKLKYEAVHVQADRAMEDEADRKLEAKLAAARGEKVPGPDAPAPKPAAPKDEFELGDDPVIEAPAGDGAAADKPAEAAAPAAPKDEFELGDDEVIEVQADKKPGEAAAEPVVAAAADAAPAEPAAGRDEFELGDDPVIEGDKPAQAAVAKEVAVAADGDPKVAQNDQAPVAEDLPPPVYEDKESLPVPSSSQIFMAGVFPGMLMILAIALFAIITGFRRKVLRTKFTLPNAWAGLVGARYVVPIPFIIAVGIFGGFFTAAEAASATAVYTIIMQMGLYRDFGFKAFRRALVESVVLVGGILIIVVAAMGLLNFLVFASVPDMILGFIENVMPENLPVFGLFTIPRQITFLLLLNVFLLIVGCLMDVFSAILVVLPILLPVAYRFGIHPAHLAVIFIANLEIGYSSPPAGINLFVASLRFNRPVLKMYAASIAFLALMFASLLVITYWPALSLWLVEFTGVQ